MCSIIVRNAQCLNTLCRYYSTSKPQKPKSPASDKFETVFSFPTVRYFALMNRLKVYQIVGCAIIVPGAGLMELFNTMPGAFLSAAYIGVSSVAVTSLCTWPFKDIIGHLYINEENTRIKISSVDIWGRRIDRIIETEDWIPILELKPKFTDAFFLSPQLSDGTTYKLPIKFGKVLNSSKMGEVLE